MTVLCIRCLGSAVAQPKNDGVFGIGKKDARGRGSTTPGLLFGRQRVTISLVDR
jgi:hypothetical protein